MTNPTPLAPMAETGFMMFVQEVPGVTPVRPQAPFGMKVLWMGSVNWKIPAGSMLSGDLRLVTP